MNERGMSDSLIVPGKLPIASRSSYNYQHDFTIRCRVFEFPPSFNPKKKMLEFLESTSVP